MAAGEKELFRSLNREERLWIMGARIHDLETTRDSYNLELDKVGRWEKVFWGIIEYTITDDEWVEFAMGDKMHKYIKTLKDLEKYKENEQNMEHAKCSDSTTH